MKAAPSTAAPADIVTTDDDVEHVFDNWPDVGGEDTRVEYFRGGKQAGE